MHTFKLSSRLFGGFTNKFTTNQIESLEYVIQEIVAELMDILTTHNLIHLKDELNKLHFHYHDYTLIDVISSTDENQIWYICDSCNRHLTDS
jgi:NTP pyrophosphatase (non-canonical NTP hydrolase)